QSRTIGFELRDKTYSKRRGEPATRAASAAPGAYYLPTTRDLKAQVSPTSSVLRSAQFLGESDEKPCRPADIAEPIRGFMLDYFAYELRACGAFQASRRCRPRRT